MINRQTSKANEMNRASALEENKIATHKFAVKKAVIPAAGLGTRFLPWTGINAKELIPVIDPKTKKIRTVIELVVEEAHEAGLNSILLITALGKSSIQEHLTKQQIEKNIPVNARLHYIDQKEPKGLGDAILHARDFVANENFAVLLGDDFHSKNPVSQLMRAYEKIKAEDFGAILTVMKVSDEQAKRYGIMINPVPVKDSINIMLAQGVVEKPQTPPSNLAITGRYILSSKIFDYLKKTKPGARAELELTDALNLMAKDRCKIYCIELEGIRYDAGTPKAWFQAIQDVGNEVFSEKE
ncbi:MAG: UTP--glucose-1-phosphate uridylyltransferase [Candidatus Aenigmarchaeota archaeon]|nr:UTP--glucose-1-phosphate uridylyltransferase [Candidatus Aenigmarchaeota archaeon]